MENKNITREDKSTYYYSNNQRIPLARESAVYAVKFEGVRDPRDGSLSRPAFRLINEDSEKIGSIPNYNIQVFKAKEEKIKTGSLNNSNSFFLQVKNLKSEPSVEYATIAYRRHKDIPASKLDDLMFATREFTVQFKANISRQQIDEINAKYRVQISRALDYAPNGFVLRAVDADGEYGAVVLANVYFESGQVLFANPNFVQRRHIRSVLEKKKTSKALSRAKISSKTETTSRNIYLSKQWHLQTAKVTDSWKITKGNSDIKVAILDDGIDTAHPEFAGKILVQYDFATGTTDATPKNAGDNHGTACAGVAVAKGVKAFGAAPNCSLMAVNTPTFLGSVEEAEMFKWVCDQGADIISCSWGPKDGTGAFDPLPDNVRASINYCVTKGRQGLGIPIFWAAGNGNEPVSNDGYAANPDVIAVAASSSKETRSWYSDFGPEVFICAPSNGDSDKGELGIFTVDRRGKDGYNPDKRTGTSHPKNDLDYTDSFGGTSSATPLAAGVAALMLSINPKLRVEDIRNILKDTADQIDTAGGDYDAEGHSVYYGYGRINALRAVAGARDFSSGTPDKTLSITGPSFVNRTDDPPVFEINKGGRKLYAVELAATAELFDSAAHGTERTDSNFYASWQKGMLDSTPFTLPAAAWDNLKTADRLYFRVHVADDNKWANYAVTTADDDPASAPGFDVTDDEPAGEGEPGESEEISITAPESIGRKNEAPTFEISKGGRNLYAVEIASRADLFDHAAHGDERDAHNFYASWEQGMLEEVPFTMPSAAWESLKVENQLYYRVHVADDNSWSNHGVSIPDNDAASAPFIKIVSGSRMSRGKPLMKSNKKIAPFILAEAKKEDESLWSK